MPIRRVLAKAAGDQSNETSGQPGFSLPFGKDGLPGPIHGDLTPVNNYTKINTTLAGAQFSPAICALSGGGYIIVWEDSPSGSIYGQRFGATGQPVGSELHLDSVQGASALWVSVAATAANGFVIAFQAGFGNSSEIFARRYDSLNNPVGGLFAANTTSPNEQFNPHVTALDNGGLLFTWDTRVTLGNDVVNQEVRGRIYDAGGQPLGNDFAIAPMTATDLHGLSAISSLSGGGFVVTWQRAKDGTGNFEIVGQRYTSGGGTVGAQFQANTQTANNQYGNDVARLTDGGFVVSWVDPGSGNVGGRIVARHYGADGNPIGGEILIDSKAAGAYGRTVVTALAGGGYVVGWIEDDGSDDNVLARAFGANDVAMGAAFEMSFNSPFNGNFFSDGAVTLANGNVVFAWDGPSITPPGGPATGQDIYMRQYSLTGGSAPINGTSGPDTLNGTSGNDEINGLGGNDTINGLGGNDVMRGGPGDDIYYVDSAADVIVELSGEGFDRVLTTVDYTLAEGVYAERLEAADAAGTAPLALGGNALENVIYGNAGSNILYGKGGFDTLFGGAGDDFYYVSDAGDFIVELAGGGFDRILTSVDYSLNDEGLVEVISTDSNTGTAALALGGNNLENIIIGNDGNNILYGKGGFDTIYGRAGNDTYYVSDAGDLIVELQNEGNDRIYASVDYTLFDDGYVETLSTEFIAGTANLSLGGNNLANTLIGNNGQNTLYGKGGNDTLYGHGGADTFLFVTKGAGDVDTIGDFVSGTDKIAFYQSVYTGLASGTLSANAFVIGSAAADGDDRIIYNQATGALFYDADGTGAQAAIQFATVTPGQTLVASDFVVF